MRRSSELLRGMLLLALPLGLGRRALLLLPWRSPQTSQQQRPKKQHEKKTKKTLQPRKTIESVCRTTPKAFAMVVSRRAMMVVVVVRSRSCRVGSDTAWESRFTASV